MKTIRGCRGGSAGLKITCARLSQMKSGQWRWCTFACLAAILCLLPLGAFGALPYSLGQANNYAVLGLGGISSAHGQIEVYQSATIINGNVGAGPYADWTHGIDATINGRIDYDTTD